MNAASDVAARREAILATLRRILIDELSVMIPAHALGPDIPLFGLGVGLDSVDGVELALSVEREFGVEIPQDDRFPAITRSLNSIIDHVLGVGEERRERFPRIARALDGLIDALGVSDDSRRAHVAPTPVHAALRNSVACVRDEHVTVVELEAERLDVLWETLEQILPCELALYDGQARPALLVGEDGSVRADVTVARLQGRVLLFAEGVDAVELQRRLAPFSDRVRARDLGPETVSRGLHGPFAWEIAGAWLGRNVSVLPPLGILQLPNGVIVLRSGRAGEYGFEVMLPRALAPELLAELEHLSASFEVEQISPDDFAAAVVEAGGFSARALLGRPLRPAELQLEWRLAPRWRRVREVGPAGDRRSVLFVAAGPRSGTLRLAGREVGEVVFSHTRSDGSAFGLAVVETAVSHPGLTFSADGDETLTTCSAPLFRPRSLGVRPQVDRFKARS